MWMLQILNSQTWRNHLILAEDDTEVPTLQDNLCPPGSMYTSPPGPQANHKDQCSGSTEPAQEGKNHMLQELQDWLSQCAQQSQRVSAGLYPENAGSRRWDLKLGKGELIQLGALSHDTGCNLDKDPGNDIMTLRRWCRRNARTAVADGEVRKGKAQRSGHA